MSEYLEIEGEGHEDEWQASPDDRDALMHYHETGVGTEEHTKEENGGSFEFHGWVFGYVNRCMLQLDSLCLHHLGSMDCGQETPCQGYCR